MCCHTGEWPARSRRPSRNPSNGRRSRFRNRAGPGRPSSASTRKTSVPVIPADWFRT